MVFWNTAYETWQAQNYASSDKNDTMIMTATLSPEI